MDGQINMLQPVDYDSGSEWRVHNPVKLTVGRGCRRALVDQLINKTLLIVTSQRGRCQAMEDPLLGALIGQNRVLWADSVHENPKLTELQAEADRLAGISFDAVIAFGGGSAIDAAKVLNVCLAPGIKDCGLYRLLVEPHQQAGARPRSLYAVPTTSGTGSEVTPFATVWDDEAKEKRSLAGSMVWPTAAFVDPELTDSLPLAPTISTGLDAINQAAESIWNKNANSITLGYAIRALQLGFAALPQLAAGEGGQLARDQMAEASLLAGLAISQTRTALCHSISYPMTAHFGVPHGLACAFTMPAVLRHNLEAEDGRFAQLARAITGGADLEGLLACFDQLHEALDVRSLVQGYIKTLDQLLSFENEMYTAGRADNNLVAVTSVEPILKVAWG